MKEKEHSIREIIKDPIQFTFYALAMITVIMLVPFTVGCYHHIRVLNENAPKGYMLPKFSDFKLTIACSVGFTIIQIVSIKAFSGLVAPFIKDCPTELKRQMRITKTASSLYEAIYFISATLWGYYILKDQEYLPPSLGGTGEFKLAFSE